MTDRTITFRVDRHSSTQPDWARNFLNISGFNAIGQLDPVLYSLAGPNLRKKISETAPFVPPVTLLYTDDCNWEFTWASEAEQTMFLLKWS